jgi:hypothetical protein
MAATVELSTPPLMATAVMGELSLARVMFPPGSQAGAQQS